MAFQKAKREQIWLKVLLAGPSGSGKSYSALRLAKGISQKNGSKIAAIDTENGRIRYYATEFDFDDMKLEAPYTPEKYSEAIDDAVDAGYNILIIDSITHEWDYCVDIHSKMPGNSYTNWGKVTPRHDKFMEKILQSPIHIIATVRGKDEYVIEEKNGKQTPKKVGLGYKQRDGVEYNYTATFNIDQQTHVADSTKDNTHIFEGRYEILTEKDGILLYEWANEGIAVQPREKKIVPVVEVAEVIEENVLEENEEEMSVEELRKKITETASILDADSKKTFGAKVKELINTANYNKCDDPAQLLIILDIAKSL